MNTLTFQVLEVKDNHNSLYSFPSIPLVTTGNSVDRDPMIFGESRQQVVRRSGKSSDHHPREETEIGHIFRSSKNGEIGGDGTAKWSSFKVKMVKNMIHSPKAEKSARFALAMDYQIEGFNGNSSSSSNSNSPTGRVCSDCNTTSTPLWRSGPRGPKSLCNACGIRQRKARKAAAAVTTEAELESPYTKEKKLRNSDKECCVRSGKKVCFRNLTLNLRRSSNFSEDVEEAAILLMELSCGFVKNGYV